MMPGACCIALRDFPGTVRSLPINGSLNAKGLVIAEVYKKGQIGILYNMYTKRWLIGQLICHVTHVIASIIPYFAIHQMRYLIVKLIRVYLQRLSSRKLIE